MHIATIVFLMLLIAGAAGYAFFVFVKAVLAYFERIQGERRQANLMKYSMTQFRGTKASERNW